MDVLFKNKKRVAIASCITAITLLGAAIPVSAADTPSNTIPTVSYGNTTWTEIRLYQ
ncbi:hypothetical protein MH117_18825 [Paenibacillus sp. ACRRX]|uniref:hypothetical protein n=1 Tax=Paenibacillus sp. ACRRX TaxID=2918206 RepID=UPI001EF6C668|nr:hypothetical protein [Paenibacillus sp. ACRRX]MCG7409466.1 hypothetical protein [Paenibacillus sp. ACRRX]